MKSTLHSLIILFVVCTQSVTSFSPVVLDVVGRTTKGWLSLPKFYSTRQILRSASDDMTWDPKSGPKLDFNEDYYTVLEASPTFDAKALKKAYYLMVFKYHPDNRKNDSESEKKMCNQQMMVINNAYTKLKDPELRRIYVSVHEIARTIVFHDVLFGLIPSIPIHLLNPRTSREAEVY